MRRVTFWGQRLHLHQVRKNKMEKEKVVLLMLEKLNNDTRFAGVSSGADIADVEQQIIKNQPFLQWQMGNMYDLLVEKGVITP